MMSEVVSNQARGKRCETQTLLIRIQAPCELCPAASNPSVPETFRAVNHSSSPGYTIYQDPMSSGLSGVGGCRRSDVFPLVLGKRRVSLQREEKGGKAGIGSGQVLVVREDG